ncbi:hypothetical protein CALVIDRAFT_104640 [Calocera viscosa TUFC12733]|uniref:Methyltransferase domain-containing protein n=1 Tax=Calocera viscosa (strain TUFC12733) TaxID=1330018 RepID=A0A167MP72_CALVF|nr:hypothetical protein CALVIDRAFT_104640 [Calocera viscosa TUFC12733]
MFIGNPNFALPHGFDDLDVYATELKEYLSSPLVQSLLNGHPNEIAKSGPPLAWAAWWNWACSLTAHDILVFAGDQASFELPDTISNLIDDAARLALPRASVQRQPLPQPLPKGQTPKKVHEVQQFSQLIAQLAKVTNASRVVDVGAGQGYLSLELASKHGENVLALDFSEAQTSGSIHWAQRAKQQNLKLTHVTHHISRGTLPGLVRDWLQTEDSNASSYDKDIIVVGLHACGSLTVEVMRACIDNIKAQNSSARAGWNVEACAIVGCCYNMLSEDDKHLSILDAPFLPSDAFQLAAQPWLPPTPPDLSLTVRKITYRALLGRLLHQRSVSLPADARVRRLKDSAYTSWDAYVTAACNRMGIDAQMLGDQSTWTEDMERIAAGLSILHILRAKLGPVIESWILLDRYIWLREQLEAPGLASVELQWVFDSAISARSAAFIVKSYINQAP